MSILLTKIRSRLSDSSGVTLIELMVSLFVFAIGMLAVTAMCLISIQGNSLVNRTTQANFLAQSAIESLLNETRAVLYDYATGGMLSYDSDNYHVTPSVILVPAYDASLLPENYSYWVNVAVDWEDSKGSHGVQLRSQARGL